MLIGRGSVRRWRECLKGEELGEWQGDGVGTGNCLWWEGKAFAVEESVWVTFMNHAMPCEAYKARLLVIAIFQMRKWAFPMSHAHMPTKMKSLKVTR